MSRKIPNTPRNIAGIFVPSGGNDGVISVHYKLPLPALSLCFADRKNFFVFAGFSECVKLLYRPSVEKAFGNTVLIHDIFDNAVINTERVAQIFGCIFTVLQNAKSSVTVTQHVCVHI